MPEIFETDYKAKEELSPKDKENDEKLFNTMKNLYTQCISSYNKNNDNMEILMKFINNFNISEKLSNHDGLTVLLAELHSNGVELFFKVDTEEVYGLPYKYIPSIKYSSISNFNEKLAILEVELSKEKLSFMGNFRDEDEYNLFLQEKKDIIEKYKEYIRNVLQFMYGSDNNIIEKMVETVIKVERKLSPSLIE